MQIAIPLYDGFTALDAVGPYEVLVRLLGSQVVFCGAEGRPHRTDTKALAIHADATFAEVTAPDIIVVPGGPGSCGRLRRIGRLWEAVPLRWPAVALTG